MKGKLIVSMMAMIFVLVTAGIGVAEGPDGNDRKGKYTYRSVYKACAKRGEVDSRTPIISPSDKTMAQWKRLFEKKEFEDFKCQQEWNNLSDEDVLDIYTYLYKHAADSPTPAKCK